MGLLVASGRLVGGHAVHQGLGIDRQIRTGIAFQRGRDVVDVLATVTVRGKRDGRTKAFQVPQPHAQREDVHLAAGVVDVVLALDVESGRFEDVREGRTVGGTPAVSHMQRSGGIGGDELHLDAPSGSERGTCAPGAGDEDATYHRGVCPGRHGEVDEPGAGDVHRRNRVRRRQPSRDPLGNFARLSLRDAGQSESDGARKVAVAVPATPLDRNLGQRIDRQLPVVAKRRQRMLEERADMRLHRSDAPKISNRELVWPANRVG